VSSLIASLIPGMCGACRKPRLSLSWPSWVEQVAGSLPKILEADQRTRLHLASQSKVLWASPWWLRCIEVATCGQCSSWWVLEEDPSAHEGARQPGCHAGPVPHSSSQPAAWALSPTSRFWKELCWRVAELRGCWRWGRSTLVLHLWDRLVWCPSQWGAALLWERSARQRAWSTRQPSEYFINISKLQFTSNFEAVDAAEFVS
jgi:hypothetical protein